MFLENTPLITKDKDYNQLLNEFLRRNYNCAFMVLSASELGARHKRDRWFLLAVQKDAPPLELKKGGYHKLAKLFNQKPRSNTEQRAHKRAKCLCQSYGNSVVPAQAAKALFTLNAELSSATKNNLTPTKIEAIKIRYPTLVLD